ncbi:MAG: hypothetical protein KAI72_03145, partial [Candidatus Pacebacteria bacterium]|nr:hypothetical protein [Candidatus Paceibacterota bacterium]
INVNSKGYQHSEGIGQGTDALRAGGAGYGGYGGDGSGAAGGFAHGSITVPTDIGSGGGDYSSYQGGAGGGAIKLTISGITTISGNITANGGNGGSYSGGGSGGGIYITTGTLAGAGTITTNGGTGNDTAGGGGGGRTAVYYTTDSSAVIYQAYGGSPTGRYGAAGTVYTKAAAAANGDLLIDNGDRDSLDDRNIGTTFINETITFDTITIQNYGNLGVGDSANIIYTTLDWSTRGCITDNGGTFSLLSGGGVLTVPETARFYAYTTRTHNSYVINGYMEARQVIVTAGNFSIGTAGTLTHEHNATTQQYVLDVTVADLAIAAGGVISADARGFQHSEGTGQGTDVAWAGGAGYGGDGGDGSAGAGGSAYGSITAPTDIGSGGGDYSGTGGIGGGAVKLTISGTTTLAGTISVNGGNGGSASGGGSGGSVYITTGTLEGAGTIITNGGIGNGTSGGGGGGRIAVYYTTNSSAVTYQSYGGSPAGRYGGAGTVYTKAAAAANGNLLINNGDHSGDRTPFIDSNWTFDNVTISGAGKLDANGFNLTINNSFTNSGTFIHSDQTVTFAGTTTGNTITSGGSSFYNLIFDGVGGEWIPFDASAVANDLTITNGTFDLDDENLTVTGIFSNNSILKLEGIPTQVITFTNGIDTDSGVIEYNGAGTYTGLITGGNYYSLTFSGTGTYALGSNIDVNGNFVLGAGVLNALSYFITIGGDSTNTGGTLNGSSTVVFDDNTKISHIYGDMTFNNFTCATAGKELQFESTKTQIITGTLTFTGQSGNLIVLKSTSDDTQWKIDPQGTRSVDYVNVKDSNNINVVAIDPNNSVDSLNNTNWAFTAMHHFTITGTSTQTAGGDQTITITAKSADGSTYTSYTGDHDLTFSGASISTEGTAPTASNKDSADIDFGSTT